MKWKILEIKGFKTCWAIWEERGSSFDKCDAAPRKWRHFKRPPLGIRQANCTLLSHPWTFLWHKVKNRRKRGLLFIAWQRFEAGSTVEKAKHDSVAVLTKKKKEKEEFSLFSNDTMSVPLWFFHVFIDSKI